MCKHIKVVERLKPAVAWGKDHGWEIFQAKNGRFILKKAGFLPVYISGTPSCPHASNQIIRQLIQIESNQNMREMRRRR